jgi:hypothetical protein
MPLLQYFIVCLRHLPEDFCQLITMIMVDDPEQLQRRPLQCSASQAVAGMIGISAVHNT